MKIKIAARKSDLARIQALTVGEALLSVHKDLEIEYFFSASLGDKNLSDPLWKIPEKGVFTQDFTNGLINKEYDLVVHSWKDLPTEENEKTQIVATLPRADMRDLFLFRPESMGRKQVKILSSSPRRERNGGRFLKDVLPWAAELEFQFVRGNVPTRIRKLLSGEGDGLFVAKAALDRLLSAGYPDLQDVQQHIRNAFGMLNWMVLPLSQNPAAPAQGALAIETLKGRHDLVELLKPIHCENTFQCVLRERKILNEYGGGCHQKIGASLFPTRHGVVYALAGETPEKKALEKFELLNESFSERKIKKVHSREMFPMESEDKTMFHRESVTVNLKSLDGNDLYVAKAEAWPNDLKIAKNAVVWTSGIPTWKRLAERGVWVNGCQDGLGDELEKNLSWILGRDERFVKLTHLDAQGRQEERNAVGTYLIREDRTQDLSVEGKTHFYWSSYSHFKAVVDRFPIVRKLRHACGPGLTFDLIRQDLGENAELEVFLSKKNWIEAYSLELASEKEKAT